MPTDDVDSGTDTTVPETDEIQDNSRERQMRTLFRLNHSGQNRGGLDAVDEAGNAFELKSGTKPSITTGRDVGLHTIDKWRTRYFLVCKGRKPRGEEFVIEQCLAASPAHMDWWFTALEERLAKSVALIDKVMKIVRRDGGLTEEETRRLEGLLLRGYTLNNPKFNWNRLIAQGAVAFDMTGDLPAQLRMFVAKNPLSTPTRADALRPEGPALRPPEFPGE